MSDTSAVERATTPRDRPRDPGRIEQALIRWLMRQALVVAVEPISAGFRLIDLEGEALKATDWTPGHKIQLSLGGLRTTRTYTPVEWDADRGRTRIVAWSHGDGPGSLWSTNVAKGDTCAFFGPRRSLEIGDLEAQVVLFGDETSVGLASALTAAKPPESVHLLLEVVNPDECALALHRLGIGARIALARKPDDQHLGEIEARLLQLADAGAICVLTGRAPAIQRLHRALKTAGVQSSRIRSKAYWAPGKVGLD